MAQSLDQILQELDAGYAPSRQLINQRLTSLPSEADAQIQGLDAQKNAAFDDITAGARSRGMGFSGIPLGEQAKYVSTDYLPAVAKVRTSQNDVKNSLLQALNDINLDQRKTAMSIREQQQQMDFQREQAAAAQRAARASQSALSSSLFGGVTSPTAAQAPQQKVSAQQQADYNFVKGLISQVSSGNGNTVAMIIRQARDGNQRSKEIMRQFYALQNKPIPVTFRSFL